MQGVTQSSVASAFFETGQHGREIAAKSVFFFDLFVSRRGWCGHLCPVGAFYGLLGTTVLGRMRSAPAEGWSDELVEAALGGLLRPSAREPENR